LTIIIIYKRSILIILKKWCALGLPGAETTGGRGMEEALIGRGGMSSAEEWSTDSDDEDDDEDRPQPPPPQPHQPPPPTPQGAAQGLGFRDFRVKGFSVLGF
jgi:hypothetical protein